MKNLLLNLQHYSAYLAVFFLAFSLNSCSDDDDVVFEPFEPTGFFEVDAEQILIGNTLTLESITVDQDTWLVAVPVGGEAMNDFISDPVMLEEGINTDVQLTLDDDAIANGDQITLMLYGDDPNAGNQGQFEEADWDDVLAESETIVVFTEDSGEAAFSEFDEDNDGLLDEDEVLNTYINDFDAWDVDDDGFLSRDEFYETTFYLTDADDDDLITEDEWNVGYDAMYGTYLDDDFTAYDVDGDGFIETTEWNDAFADTVWFDTYDFDDDTFVTATEWDTGLYGDWDLDNDTFISRDEYIRYSPYVWYW